MKKAGRPGEQTLEKQKLAFAKLKQMRFRVTSPVGSYSMDAVVAAMMPEQGGTAKVRSIRRARAGATECVRIVMEVVKDDLVGAATDQSIAREIHKIAELVCDLNSRISRIGNITRSATNGLIFSPQPEDAEKQTMLAFLGYIDPSMSAYEAAQELQRNLENAAKPANFLAKTFAAPSAKRADRKQVLAETFCNVFAWHFRDVFNRDLPTSSSGRHVELAAAIWADAGFPTQGIGDLHAALGARLKSKAKAARRAPKNLKA